eukprot:TRINITY_DN3271_c0_g2_i1.p1 TRINITY_DN3271_c0_g2~~TRINITY_DN3271_c0_g2_i1.p1  ORF type:complete len:874 (+),score=210.15 TRINITY_DN3271_c0_g2_i1:67-2622(+)
MALVEDSSLIERDLIASKLFNTPKERLLVLTKVQAKRKKGVVRFGSRSRTKTRYLCLTLKGERFNMHKVKVKELNASVRRTWQLSDLTHIQNLAGAESEFTLIFSGRAWNFSAVSIPNRNHFLASCVGICRDRYNVTVNVQGIDLAPVVGDTLEAVLNEEDENRVSRSRRINQAPYIDARERALLDEILSQIDVDSTDAQAVMNHLQSQLLQLEEANIYAMMNSEDSVVELVGRMGEASEALDGVDETLDVYKQQMRIMNEDLQQIEETNLRLAVQKKNHNELKATLEGLVEQLTLHENAVIILNAGRLTTSEAVRKMNAAVRLLQKALTAELQPWMLDMAAVKERKQLFNQFKVKAATTISAFLIKRFNQLSEMAAQERKKPSEAREDAFPTGYGSFFEDFRMFNELVDWMRISNYEMYTEVLREYAIKFAEIRTRDFRDFCLAVKGCAKEAIKTPPLLGSSKQDSFDSQSAPALTYPPQQPMVKIGTPVSSMTALQFFLYVLAMFAERVRTEQVFLADLFHIDAVQPDSTDAGTAEPRTDLITNVMHDLYPNARADFVTLTDAAFKADPFNVILMLAQTEKYAAHFKTSSPFLHELLMNGVLPEVTKNLDVMLELQIKSLDEKTAIKRAGVLPPFRKLPSFLDRLGTLSGWEPSKTVDYAIDKTLTALFAWLDRVAKLDPKYEHICKLENYFFFVTENKTRKLTCLDAPLKDTAALFRETLKAYSRQLVAYGLKVLTEHMDRVDELMRSMKESDVQFQASHSKQSFQLVLKQTAPKVKPAIASMYKRIQKHLVHTPSLTKNVWQQLQVTMKELFDHVADVALRCYELASAEPLPASRELVEMFEAATKQ